jgi:hypothetical protein
MLCHRAIAGFEQVKFLIFMEVFMKTRLLFYAAVCALAAGPALIAVSCGDSGVDGLINPDALNVGNYNISISPNVMEIGGKAFTDRTKANSGATITLTVIPPMRENTEDGAGGGGALFVGSL